MKKTKLLLLLLLLVSSLNVEGQCNLQAHFYSYQSCDTLHFSNNSQNFSYQNSYASWTINGVNVSNNFWGPSYTNGNVAEWIYVCLTVTDSTLNNCTDTYCDSVYISPYTCQLQTGYSYTINNDSIYFNNISTGCDSSFNSYWFINNNFSSDYSPTYYLNGQTGWIQVCLDMSDPINNCCQDSYCDSIYIWPDTTCYLQAMFTYLQNQTYDDIYFNNTSQNITNTTVSQWDFNGQTIYGDNFLNPSFSTNGLTGWKQACLTITDTATSFACSSTYCDSIFFDTICNLQAHFYSYQSCDTLHFSNTSQNFSYQNSYASWTINGVNVSNNWWFRYTNGNVAEWIYVCLTVTDSSLNNCTDTYCDSVYFSPITQCQLQADYNYTFLNDSIYFTNTTIGGDSSFITYWYLNNNNVSSWSVSNNPVFNISGITGWIQICLDTYDPNNSCCIDTKCDSIWVGNSSSCMLQSDFEISKTGNLLNFTNKSTNLPINPTYKWTINGTNYNTENVTIPDTDSSYTACLVVKNSDWTCLDTSCVYNVDANALSLENNASFNSINIYPNPSANYFTIENCMNNNIQIYNAMGQLVFSTYVKSSNEVINISTLSNGLYYVKTIESSTRVISTIKLVVNR